MYDSKRTCFTSRPNSPTISFFFFNDTATTEIYTLSLHDALPIFTDAIAEITPRGVRTDDGVEHEVDLIVFATGFHSKDRKSTRLNSSHLVISYAVFCLKKKRQFITLARSIISEIWQRL